MKKLLIAALVTSQVLGAAAPAFAQAWSPVRETETGTFSGVRLRIAFGGERREPVRAGITFAPTTRTEHQDGRIRTQIGEGLEFGMVGRQPVQFLLAGTPVNRLVRGAAGPEGERRGISTIGWIAIGVGASLVILVAATAICASDHDCLPSE